ncbi:hypothetical protein FA15DRAFT_756366 [Coprinopsis marcescibilis]|uniref:Transmembrane protein n=1 Tax=Coprinopsis marcescibilis TaxID=230819 RepID=A0A5C3KVY6_COPMA|nr:hypothetical protein FA15DRAFT_756366 [Coprinopsis marcescibilis]
MGRFVLSGVLQTVMKTVIPFCSFMVPSAPFLLLIALLGLYSIENVAGVRNVSAGYDDRRVGYEQSRLRVVNGQHLGEACGGCYPCLSSRFEGAVSFTFNGVAVHASVPTMLSRAGCHLRYELDGQGGVVSLEEEGGSEPMLSWTGLGDGQHILRISPWVKDRRSSFIYTTLENEVVPGATPEATLRDQGGEIGARSELAKRAETITGEAAAAQTDAEKKRVIGFAVGFGVTGGIILLLFAIGVKMWFIREKERQMMNEGGANVFENGVPLPQTSLSAGPRSDGAGLEAGATRTSTSPKREKFSLSSDASDSFNQSYLRFHTQPEPFADSGFR